jgi:hypothetical protein
MKYVLTITNCSLSLALLAVVPSALAEEGALLLHHGIGQASGLCCPSGNGTVNLQCSQCQVPLADIFLHKHAVDRP